MIEGKNYSRREVVGLLGTAVSGFGLAHRLGYLSQNRPRPSVYWSAVETAGLRSVASVRTSIRNGTVASSYAQIRDLTLTEAGTDPIVPSTPTVGRSPASIANANADFYVTDAAAKRVLRSAFATVVEDDPTLARPALRQLESLFDEEQWPQWIDQAHVRFGHPVDLRTGMLAEAIGLAYDWLYPYLDADERAWIVRELDRRAIQPFKVAVAQEPWWLRDKNNWMTTIVGGLGIAGMGLGEDHPESKYLIQFASEHMEGYLSIYGPKGEFNESVAYANATVRPVAFFHAYRYWSGGKINRLAEFPFPETCRWIQYLTLPPGRVVAFGDAHVDRPPWTSYVAAVAAATRDGSLQWFCETYGAEATDPLALLWRDHLLEPIPPAEAGLPLGGAFPHHGGCLIARTDWSPTAARCIVYGKAGREENHEHNDVGQLCLDAFGERLIVDLGSPSGYPADFFDEARYEYYNSSARGHNVLTFDDEEMKVPVRARGEPIGDRARKLSGRIVASAFDDAKGATWSVDTSKAYSGVDSVMRKALFLTPGVLVVLDEAALPRPRTVSLRWHTSRPCVPTVDGSFGFQTEIGRLAAQVVPLIGEAAYRFGRHEYVDPYDRSRDGDLLEQRHEPYVEIVCRTTRFAMLTLFYAGPLDAQARWTKQDDQWVLTASDVSTAVTISDQVVSLVDLKDDRTWEVPRSEWKNL